ncbi:CDGSH iron-sulfur domain-containing protein [Edaphobacter acidisoli]|nr:CDGSH iron-sulfur domain-containing protein [Edaphobacter acidisoli]
MSMSDAEKVSQIQVTKNGPYIVKGSLPVMMETIAQNDEGGSWTWKRGRDFEAGAQYALCRCGHSHKKPFCDGTHAKVGFDGTETASHASYKEQAKTYDGPGMVLEDAERLCAFARFCDNGGSIWRQIEETDDGEVRKAVVHEETHCPSGRLVLLEKPSGKAVEPELAQSIGLVEDPAENCSGPLWVRGGVQVVSADGEKYEVRNRVTLCRCGQSSNKPFCDGSHASVKFHDGLQG